MKSTNHLFLTVLLFLSIAPATGRAADSWLELPVNEALDSVLAGEKMHPQIKVYMKGQEHPAVERRIGEYKSNKRSNAFGKPREEGCEVAFISALIALQERAISEGGNAVVDIYSMTKYQRYENAEKYNCLAGNMVANVVLMGTVVKLE